MVLPGPVYRFYTDDGPKRIVYLQQAQKLYHQQNNTEGEISALTDISYLNVPVYQLDKAYKASLEALSLAESIHFPFTHYNTDAVAMITSFESKFGEPLRYALETVRVAGAAHDSIGLGPFYGRIGLLYYAGDENLEEAQKWQEKAMYTLLRTNADNGLYILLSNVVNVLCAKGQVNKAWNVLLDVSKKMPPKTLSDKLFYSKTYATCNMRLKKFDIAKKYLVRADSIEQQLEKSGYSFRHAVITEEFGQFYFLKGD